MDSTEFFSGQKVLVTGGHGFIGTHLIGRLSNCGVDSTRMIAPRADDFDLRELHACMTVMEGVSTVFHLAAVTGSIAFSRSHPASQYYDSTLIDMNVLEAARTCGVGQVVMIGNLFAYSGDVEIPIRERDLYSGLPTEAHRGVGWLKRNLAILAELYHREYGLEVKVVYSANGYGPGDSIDRQNAHVIPSLIMKCLFDNELTVWGDGSVTRDFLYVEDIADALILAAKTLPAPAYVNVGSGGEISIRQLVELIVDCTGFAGPVAFDETKGGGDARRLASIEKAQELMGFSPEVTMESGLRKTVEWYKKQLGVL